MDIAAWGNGRGRGWANGGTGGPGFANARYGGGWVNGGGWRNGSGAWGNGGGRRGFVNWRNGEPLVSLSTTRPVSKRGFLVLER